MARKRNSSTDQPALLARGDVVSFDMDDDITIDLPKNFVMLHDPTGRIIDKCTLMCCPCAIDTRGPHTVPDGIHDYVLDYFGSDADLYKGRVEIPKGPWQPLGVVHEIRYDRQGEYEDAFYHPFRGSGVELFKQKRGRAYMLVLPDGCKVDARGFVWP